MQTTIKSVEYLNFHTCIDHDKMANPVEFGKSRMSLTTRPFVLCPILVDYLRLKGRVNRQMC